MPRGLVQEYLLATLAALVFVAGLVAIIVLLSEFVG
ncbi:hypothetical protein MMUC44124_01195 [Mycolicibacterium mucogenicum DSM 44124]|nr:hypothetical protein MMUC44124_01195 [Mycolicibacterium mucogenicum DSM 44124]